MSRNIETVKTLYAAFGRGDVPTILAALRPDVAWEGALPDHGLPWLRARKGVAEMPGFFQAVAENLQFHRFEPQSFLEGGNQVATLLGQDCTILRTGKRVTGPMVHLWTFDPEGKVASFQHHADTATWRDAFSP